MVASIRQSAKRVPAPDLGIGRLAFPRLLATLLLPLSLLVFTLGPSGPYLAIGLVTLVAATAMVWRRGELQDLLFLVLMHWVMLAVIPLVGVFDMRDTLAEVPGSPYHAFFLGMLSTLVLSAGMWLGRSLSLRGETVADTGPPVGSLSGQRLATAWAAGKVLELLVLSPPAVASPLRQQLGALAIADDAVLALVVWRAFARRRVDSWTVVVFTAAVASTLGAFFSLWKEPLLIVTFVGLSTTRRLRLRQAAQALVVAGLLLYLGQWWMAARAGLRQSIREEEVTATWSQRVGSLVESARSVDAEQLERGRDELIGRLAYLEYFSRTLSLVPAELPHTYGERLGEALRHVLMPRILFPDKSYTSDSALVEEYTGLRVNENTSIGLSFVAEGYIDFGTAGVVVVSLVVGFIMGASGGVIIRFSPWRPFGVALALSMAMTMYGFGALMLKLVGHRVTVAVVWAVVLAGVGGRLCDWVTASPTQRR